MRYYISGYYKPWSQLLSYEGHIKYTDITRPDEDGDHASYLWILITDMDLKNYMQWFFISEKKRLMIGIMLIRVIFPGPGGKDFKYELYLVLLHNIYLGTWENFGCFIKTAIPKRKF